MSKSTTALIFLLATVLFVFSVKAQERDDSRVTPAERNRTGTLRQLIPGYYVFSSTSFNSGIIATSEGVVVLDALTSEAIARQEREAIAREIKQPVRFLVSSTFHNNYTWGNVAYRIVSKSVTKIIALICSPKCNAITRHPRNKRPGCRKITYRDRLTILHSRRQGNSGPLFRQGAHEERQHHFRAARPYRLRERAIFRRPISLHQRRLRRELAENTGCGRSPPGRHHRPQGHGPIPEDPRETRKGLHRFRQMLVDLRDAVQKEIARGATEDQAAAAIRLTSVRTVAGIQISKRSRRAADVPGNHGHA